MPELTLPQPLVSAAWLAEHLDAPGVLPLDASWYLPASGRDPRAEYRAAHIPGALFWDLDALSRSDTGLPHMMPEAAALAEAVGRLGIGPRHQVICYDGSGTNFSAARAWWMLRFLGHRQVAVLDGGLPHWRSEGYPVSDAVPPAHPARYLAEPRPGGFVGIEEVRRAVADSSPQLLDARSTGRFLGRDPEPRPGVRGGHIPGAHSLPHDQLIGPGGLMLPPERLADRFRAAGIDLNRPVIASCGSGVTACALILGLERLGHRDHAVYDGSWTEWGSRDDTP